MRHISTAKAALSVGSVLAVWHAIWVSLVALGWAAKVLNFILYLHFIQIAVQLAPYDSLTAFSLVALTFVIGALIGAVFALVWNWLSVAAEPTWERSTPHSPRAANQG